MVTLPDSRSMRLPPEASPTSSRVDCRRRFSSSMCRLAGLKRVSSPHCVIRQDYEFAARWAAVVRARILDYMVFCRQKSDMVDPEQALRGRDHYEFPVPDTHYVTGRSIKAP